MRSRVKHPRPDLAPAPASKSVRIEEFNLQASRPCTGSAVRHAKTPRLAVVWGGGLLASVFVTNLICFLFTNSIEPAAWDEAVGLSVRIAGQAHRHRTEGWAETRIGRYGVHGVSDIRDLRGPKIIFWGDSHVEGFPLDDRDKIAQQFNRLTAGEAGRPTAFAVGVSGSTIGTTYRLIPRYEKLASPVSYHFILITRMQFILPDDGTREPYALLSQPSPRFNESPPRKPDPRKQALLRELRRFRFPLPYLLYRQVTRTEMRFHPGSISGRSAPREPLDPPAPVAAWGFLLERLLERTEVPIAFVYCPDTPYLDGGRVNHVDGQRRLIDEFAARCRQREIPFISLHGEFSRLYETSGRFPRGFANNNRHRGHLNPHGLRLVASKVAAFLRSN